MDAVFGGVVRKGMLNKLLQELSEKFLDKVLKAFLEKIFDPSRMFNVSVNMTKTGTLNYAHYVIRVQKILHLRRVK